MANNRHKKLATFAVLSILLFVAGLVCAVVFLVKYFKDPDSVSDTLKWAAIIVSTVGFVLSLISMLMYLAADKRDAKRKEQALESIIDDKAKKGEAQSSVATGQPSAVSAPEVTYIPSREAYDFVMMGKYQTVEQKFEQIGKMDKTQFVIYVARLFSRKGYQVKLTPVVDNHDIDLLVERMGVTIAVGCILTNKVLCKEDIVCIKNGRSYYGVSNSMALTNMYFDRTALNYAKEEHMSLVDRNVLAEDFMN